SVLDAWSKAMALGELRGDNLNTIIQKGGRLSKALADSMGVSVNQLRKLGEQGKITSTAMFGVTSQLEKLQSEADAMPATVADGFTRLGNAVLVFVGEADKAVGSSSRLAEAMVKIADAIKQAPEESWFDTVFKGLGDEMAKTLAADARDLERIGRALEYLSSHNAGQMFDDAVTAMKGIKDEIPSYEAALGEAEQAVAAMALNSKGRFGEVDDAFQDLVQQILNGRGTVKSANDAIVALGEVDPSFHKMQDKIASAITWFINLRDAANEASAAAAATNDVGAFPSWRQVRNDFGPDLSGDGGSIKPQATMSRGKSPGEKFQDTLDQQKRRTELLVAETKLRAGMPPLVNDYGYALEKLRTQLDLENAAAKAGLALTPDRRKAIAELAEGYATATAEAAKLAEAQGQARQQMEDWFSTSRDITRGFIDDLVAGKSAAEALGNVFQQLGSKLLDLGLNSLFGTGSGANPFGLIGKALGFASGGYTGPGARNQPAGIVHKGEVVWSQNDIANAGGVAAVEAMRRGLAFPSLGTGSSDGATTISVPVTITAPGADAAALIEVRKEVAKLQANLPGIIKQTVARRAKNGW
ncbi:MAG: tape measure protein, partial [Devosia nanyangense]|nr:tape measure protein [Devosia nanyangense]